MKPIRQGMVVSIGITLMLVGCATTGRQPTFQSEIKAGRFDSALTLYLEQPSGYFSDLCALQLPPSEKLRVVLGRLAGAEASGRTIYERLKVASQFERYQPLFECGATLDDKKALVEFQHRTSMVRVAARQQAVDEFIESGGNDVSAFLAANRLTLSIEPAELLASVLSDMQKPLSAERVTALTLANIEFLGEDKAAQFVHSEFKRNVQVRSGATPEDRRDILRALLGGTRMGSGKSSNPLLDVWIILNDSENEATSLVEVVDLPLATRWQFVHVNDIPKLITAAPFGLLIDTRGRSSGRRIVDKENRKSERIVGSLRRRNPSYDSLVAEIASVESQLRQAQYTAATSAPGFAQGWAQGSATGLSVRLQRMYRELQSTPLEVAEDDVRSYEYEASTVQFFSSINTRMWLIDTSTGAISKASQPLEQSTSSTIDSGIDPNDRRRSNTSTAELESKFAEFSKSRRDLSVSGLLGSATGSFIASKQSWTSVVKTDAVNLASGSSEQTAPVLSESVDVAGSNSVVVISGDAGKGSGFFVSNELIVTNAHVVKGEQSIAIKTRDGRFGTAAVVKIDYGLDLALLRSTVSGEPATLGERGKVKIGASVFAIGHPRGLEFSVSRGIVAAVREVKDDVGNPYKVIQTDTPINPGNSGGPLLLDGAVVGVNTMKLMQSEGLGFAVHVDSVRAFTGLH